MSKRKKKGTIVSCLTEWGNVVKADVSQQRIGFHYSNDKFGNVRMQQLNRVRCRSGSTPDFGCWICIRYFCRSKWGAATSSCKPCVLFHVLNCKMPRREKYNMKDRNEIEYDIMTPYSWYPGYSDYVNTSKGNSKYWSTDSHDCSSENNLISFTPLTCLPIHLSVLSRQDVRRRNVK